MIHLNKSAFFIFANLNWYWNKKKPSHIVRCEEGQVLKCSIGLVILIPFQATINDYSNNLRIYVVAIPFWLSTITCLTHIHQIQGDMSLQADRILSWICIDKCTAIIQVALGTDVVLTWDMSSIWPYAIDKTCSQELNFHTQLIHRKRSTCYLHLFLTDIKYFRERTFNMEAFLKQKKRSMPSAKSYGCTGSAYRQIWKISSLCNERVTSTFKLRDIL